MISMTDANPWKIVLFSLGAMVVLAILDFVGAVCAKQWTEAHEAGWFVGGLLAFGMLFLVYATILHVAELSVVTFGWIVFLQVGLLVYERVRYDVDLPPGKWIAIALILLLQAYLVLAPSSSAAAR